VTAIELLHEFVDLAVCGAHMQNLPLNKQLTELGGTLVKATTTSPEYQLFDISSNEVKRPGMIRNPSAGSAIEVEVWRLPRNKAGDFLERVKALVSEYPRVLIVNADNVGSHHLQRIRKATRGGSVILMGKNTLIRKAIRDHLDVVPAFEVLLNHVVGNVGLVFTKDDLSSTRDKLLELKVAAPAKPGSISPVNVTIPKGNTGLEPGKTTFLQALNIPSKITKGQIEITSDITLVKIGDKVGPSECALLSLLNIKPFSYGLSIVKVYDSGQVIDVKVLDITDDFILSQFASGVARLASLSLGLHFPTLAAFPHMFLNAYKNIVAVSVATEYTFKQTEKLKHMIANPGEYAAAAPAAAPAAAAHSQAKAAPAAPVKEEKVEEEDDFGGGMSLFGDDE